MKRIYFFAAVCMVGLIAVIISSCQVEITKRLYGMGYYVDWHWKQGNAKKVSKPALKKVEYNSDIALAKNQTAQDQEPSLSLPLSNLAPANNQYKPDLSGHNKREEALRSLPSFEKNSQPVQAEKPLKQLQGTDSNLPYLPFAFLTGILLLLTPPARKTFLQAYNYARRFLPSRAAKTDPFTDTASAGCGCLLLWVLLCLLAVAGLIYLIVFLVQHS